MNILMISPGSPSSETSGAGVAIHKIASELAAKTSLTIIQPEDVNTKERKVSMESFTDTAVVKDITKINVTSHIGPYAYSETQEKAIQQEELYKVRSELTVFTDGVIEEVNAVDFDIIYAHDWISFEAALKIKEVSKKPLVLHVHSLDVDRISSVNHSWIFDLEQKAFEESDLILTVSQYTSRRIQEHYGIHIRKIKVVHNGVDIPPLVEATRKFHEPVVLFAGRLSGQKGPQTFIKIAEEVLEHNPDVRFVIAGEGELKNDLLEMSAHKNIGDKVHFTGYISRGEMNRVYSEAAVLCMPSVSEPYGLVATEAAAAKIPVVISKTSGAAEVLPEAVLVEHSDVNGFAKSILDLLDNKASVDMITEKNFDSVKEMDWGRTAHKILEVLNSLN